MEAVHKSVLLNEVLQFLQPEKANSLLIDSTLGEGGHTKAFLKKYGDLQVVGLDADKQIQERAKERLAAFEPRVKFVLTWFDDFYDICAYDIYDAMLTEASGGVEIRSKWDSISPITIPYNTDYVARL